jgi:hypothetical protein
MVSSGRCLWIQRWTFDTISSIPRLPWDWLWPVTSSSEFTANQFVLETSPLRLKTSNFIFQLNTCGYNSYVTSSLTRGRVCRLQLMILASADIFRSSPTRLPQYAGPGPRIYIVQEQGGPVIPPGTGFHFRRLLRITGLRWRYSIPPPHGSLNLHNIMWTSVIH